ncbi:hypothetical protein ACFXPT_38790 [Streptomyces goshikiensis]|uniref:hypothetical protein n=1 Tax=Streptomyces goshikiensis TaxID=1942 RepID=UPI003697B602
MRQTLYFSGRFDSECSFRHDAAIPNIEAGEYELYLGTLNTVKTGGYWHGSKAALELPDVSVKDKDCWTRIPDFS